MQGTGINSNYFDLESGEEYWVSGIKKDMTDRHWAGGGTIMIEKRILSDYLNLVGIKELPGSGYELTEVQTEKPIEKIYELENKIVKPDKFDPGLRYKAPGELTIEELKFVISISPPNVRLISKDRTGYWQDGTIFVVQHSAKIEKSVLQWKIRFDL